MFPLIANKTQTKRGKPHGSFSLNPYIHEALNEISNEQAPPLSQPLRFNFLRIWTILILFRTAILAEKSRHP